MNKQMKEKMLKAHFKLFRDECETFSGTNWAYLLIFAASSETS